MSARPHMEETNNLFEFVRHLPRQVRNGPPRSRVVESSITPVGLLLVALSAAAILIGWLLLLASLLYVVAEYSTTTWLLTSFGLALAHGVLGLACWHYAREAMQADSRGGVPGKD